MVDGRVGGQSDGVDTDPLPELNVFSHRVRFHFALHLNVEDLQSFCRCPKNKHTPELNPYTAS